MKWYIGQDVVCIKNHSQGAVKEGDVFTIRGLQQGCCLLQLDVGINTSHITQTCSRCNKVSNKNSLVHWFGETLFAPLESITDISEIEELLKEPIFQT